MREKSENCYLSRVFSIQCDFLKNFHCDYRSSLSICFENFDKTKLTVLSELC